MTDKQMGSTDEMPRQMQAANPHVEIGAAADLKKWNNNIGPRSIMAATRYAQLKHWNNGTRPK